MPAFSPVLVALARLHPDTAADNHPWAGASKEIRDCIIGSYITRYIIVGESISVPGFIGKAGLSPLRRT